MMIHSIYGAIFLIKQIQKANADSVIEVCIPQLPE